jgi:aminoacyl tRNA synthase complex-interacting multifunctional protein 1
MNIETLILGSVGVDAAKESQSGESNLLTDAPKTLTAGISTSELTQYLDLSKTLKESDLKGLNSLLDAKTYLIGNVFSLADAAVYIAVASKPEMSITAYPSLLRYVLHIQTLVKRQSGIKLVSYTSPPTLIPVIAAAAAKPSADKGDKGADNKKDGKESKDKKKEDKKPATAPVAEAKPAEIDPSKLDIRVGEVVKCWNHEDSEKLLCEQVDCGEESGPRNIASGIRAHYSAEEFVGKRVMVLANLKERAIAGFKSQGMVLCACNEDHSVVKIIEPPANAKKGDKVEFEGFTGEPATPSQIGKKKILEGLFPFLKTDDKGVAYCDKTPFKVNGGFVTSQLKGGAIS